MAARTLAQLRWLVRGELRERGIFTDAKAGTVSLDFNSSTATAVNIAVGSWMEWVSHA